MSENNGQISVIDTVWTGSVGRTIVLQHGVEQNISVLIEWDKPGEESLTVLFYGTKDQWEKFVTTEAYTSRYTPVIDDIVHREMGPCWV